MCIWWVKLKIGIRRYIRRIFHRSDGWSFIELSMSEISNIRTHAQTHKCRDRFYLCRCRRRARYSFVVRRPISRNKKAEKFTVHVMWIMCRHVHRTLFNTQAIGRCEMDIANHIQIWRNRLISIYGFAAATINCFVYAILQIARMQNPWISFCFSFFSVFTSFKRVGTCFVYFRVCCDFSGSNFDQYSSKSKYRFAV